MTVTLREGEKRPIYGRAFSSEELLTIGSSPAPSCTLYDSSGVAVTGLDNVVATGYDVAEAASVEVWYNLDTTSPAILAPGIYSLVFTFKVTGEDGLARTVRPAARIKIIDEAA